MSALREEINRKWKKIHELMDSQVKIQKEIVDLISQSLASLDAQNKKENYDKSKSAYKV